MQMTLAPARAVSAPPATPLAARKPSRITVKVHPLGVVLTLLWAVPAFAYPGEQLLNFGAQYIIAPLGIFAVIIALAASFFRPDMVKSAVYAAILCAVLFFVVRMSGQLTSIFQAN